MRLLTGRVGGRLFLPPSAGIVASSGSGAGDSARRPAAPSPAIEPPPASALGPDVSPSPCPSRLLRAPRTTRLIIFLNSAACLASSALPASACRCCSSSRCLSCSAATVNRCNRGVGGKGGVFLVY